MHADANVKTEGLRTVDALKYASLDRRFWNSIITRGLYSDLPELHPGRTGRFFGSDDLVAMEVLSELLRIGVIVHIACRIAMDLRAWLRQDRRVEKLYLVIVAEPDGSRRAEIVKEPPAESTTLWIIHVAKARRLARKAIAEQLAREGDDE